VHAVVLVLAIALPWAAPRPRVLVTLLPEALPVTPPYGGTRATGGPKNKKKAGFGAAPQVVAPEVAPSALPAPVPPARAPAATPVIGDVISPPQAGDGRLWVSPLPALPAAVAEVIYGDTLARDSAAIGRLRAMVDSLGQVLVDSVQRRRRPDWTTKVAGQTFGIDSQYIHIAGIKIPTAALALLPISLPQGNYGEALRARQLEEMRQDLLQAAQRAENLAEFKHYVQEIRARNQAERDFAKRQRGDTTTVNP